MTTDTPYPGTIAHSRRMKEWWSDPANRESHRRAQLAARAERLGVTVAALERPRIWAPIAERRRVLMDLYRQGLTQQEVWKLYPNEDPGVLWRCNYLVRKEREKELDALL